jgi:hypothetical protein
MPAKVLYRAFPFIGAFWRRYPLRLTLLLGGRQAELFHAGRLIHEDAKWGTGDHSLLDTLLMYNLRTLSQLPSASPSSLNSAL